MAALRSKQEQERWDAIHSMLEDLCKNNHKLDVVTDLLYRIIWK